MANEGQIIIMPARLFLSRTLVLCLFLTTLVSSFNPVPLEASEESYYYKQALKLVREGRWDAAYAYYNSILRNPKSRYYKVALFAKAEYYMLSKDYRAAKLAWENFIEQYPDAPETLFVYVHCYRIAQKERASDVAENYKQKIVQSQQLSLVFRKSKKFDFTSPFLHKYQAVYSIDKIEFLKDGIPFEKILY